jgi:hypothetical protein
VYFCILPSAINIKIKIHRITMLPVTLYGCETWSLTLREEERLRVYENRVLRRIFVHKRDKATGCWRNLNATADIIRLMKRRKYEGHAAHMVEMCVQMFGLHERRNHSEGLNKRII